MKRTQKEFWELLAKRAKKRRFYVEAIKAKANPIRERAGENLCPVCSVAKELGWVSVKVDLDSAYAHEIGDEMGFDPGFITRIVDAADLIETKWPKVRKKLIEICGVTS